jgi:hypothetical protein
MKKTIIFIVTLFQIVILHSQDIEKALNSKWFAMGNGSAAVNTTLNVQNWSECSFDYMISANYAPEFWGISIPLSFTFANRNFNFSHPFNQFLFAPSYKGYTLKIGVSALNWSPFTLSGHPFLGIAFEANPKNSYWSGGVMFGKMRIVNLAGDTSKIIRLGYGGNIAYRGKNYRIGFSIFKAHDLRKYSVLPMKDNFAFCLNGEYKFLKDGFVNVEWANSSITTDVDAEKQDKKFTFPDFSRFLVKQNLSTASANAYKATAGYKFASLSFELVEPEYQSLGTTYANNNYYNLTLNLAHTFKKLSLSGRFGMEERNFLGKNANHNRQFVVMANVQYRPAENINVAAAYSNFQSYSYLRNSISESEIIDPYHFTDTLAYSCVTQTAELNFNYRIAKAKKNNQNIGITASMNQTGKKNYFLSGLLSYSFSKVKSFTTGFVLQTNYQTETATLAASASAFFGDKFYKDKISWRVSLVQNNYWQEKEYNRSTLVLRGSMNFKINKHHQLQAQTSFLIGQKSNFMFNLGYNFVL